MTQRPIFLYGTLRHDPIFASVARRFSEGAPGSRVDAALSGHGVFEAPDGLPMLVAMPGEVAPGHLWRGLDGASTARLDRYEIPFGYARRPVTVATAEGPVAADAYFPPRDAAITDIPWSLDRWVTAHFPVAYQVVRELAGHDPELSGDELVRQWPMMRARAEAVRRTSQSDRPATVRRATHEGDFGVRRAGPLSGDFFKLARMDLDHERFDGSRATLLRREVLVGVDAALVLPYDPARDRVLMVEQIRAGPAWRGDPNPWTLEPVAGIVDGGETPEQAAGREGMEEAGLAFFHLERMFAAYPSPGSSTDFFHCFLGLTDLPDDTAGRGGLASEGEDIALHRLAFADAMVLAKSGEITALPLLGMLYWLAAHRDRLRA